MTTEKIRENWFGQYHTIQNAIAAESNDLVRLEMEKRLELQAEADDAMHQIVRIHEAELARIADDAEHQKEKDALDLIVSASNADRNQGYLEEGAIEKWLMCTAD
jgi:hypothetical protein